MRPRAPLVRTVGMCAQGSDVMGHEPSALAMATIRAIFRDFVSESCFLVVCETNE